MDLNNILSLTNKEYYLWTQGITHNRVPWKRSLLNLEFLEYEKRIIKKAFQWRNIFMRAKESESLPELTMYTIPVNLSSDWESQIKLKGNYFCIGLSALQNSPQCNLLTLFPHDSKICPPYKLIRITKSKKIFIENSKYGIVEPFLLIEDWEPLKSDSIYLDIPREKKYINKVIKENLTSDKTISTAFESPLVSSPIEIGSPGGITISSTASSYSFSSELLKTLLKMVPPEYRTGIKPPEQVYKGTNFIHRKGTVFRFAERPYNDRNIVSGVWGHSQNNLRNELGVRNKVYGEYSIFSTINPPNTSQGTQIWTDLFNNFSKTEITLPFSLDDIRKSDIDLTRINKVISEDMWLQIVNSRQISPPISGEHNNFFEKTLSRLKQDMDIHLQDKIKDADMRKRNVSLILNNQNENLRRLVQSFARSENRNIIESSDFTKARGLIIDNFSGILEHEDFRYINPILKQQKESKRHLILQTEITAHPKSSLLEIYDLVKNSGLFDNLEDLQEMLNWETRRGYLVKSFEGKYTWI